jgi:homoserine O-acetyltransferase
MTETSSSAARPAPGAGRTTFAAPETRLLDLPGAMALELGGTLPGVRVAYRTWGTLDADGANAVIICHALTGSADADRWWTRMFGPGRALDPARDFVICSNILGSCYGTTGPADLDPATGRPWHGAFPAITVRDMVEVQRQLAVALGVKRIKLVIGGSLGGMQVLEWGLMFPELVEAQVFIASTARHSAWAIGLGEAQRQAIFADPRWRGGDYDQADPPTAGLAAARMMAMLSYRSFPSYEERFGRRVQSADQFAIESYLRHQGRALVDRFDPASYVTLTRAMDTHDVSRGRGDFDEVLRGVRPRTLVVAIDSDILYWPAEQREVARLVPGARLAVMDSVHGHDAFLIDVDRLSDLVAEFRGRTAQAAGGDAVERAYAGTGLSLLVVGKGKVGSALLDQLAAQRSALEADHDLVLRLAGVADTRATLFDEAGVDLSAWRERLAATPDSGPFDAARAPALLDRLARLPHPVLVDLTAAAGMEEIYQQAFRRGIDVIGANKLPLAAAGKVARELRELRRQHHRTFAHDSAVGASLPVLDTLRKLVQAGDRIVRIEGMLSGTLGYLASEVQKGVALSMALRWAVGLGHTEADARDDLSGLDSARKALILAREAGLDAELSDVVVVPFLPPALLEPVELIASLRRHDAVLAAEVERLRGEGKVLRYLVNIEPAPGGRASIRVGPAAVDAHHPAARLVGVEAFVAFTTARHADRPLLVQGTGVGGALTAGGVLAELIRLRGQGEG